MGSNNQYEHKNFWGDVNAYFIPHPDMIEKDIKPFEYKADELEIPLGDGIMAQIERGPVQACKDFDNLPEELKRAYEMIFGKDFINKIYKKDGESEGGRW